MFHAIFLARRLGIIRQRAMGTNFKEWGKDPLEIKGIAWSFCLASREMMHAVARNSRNGKVEMGSGWIMGTLSRIRRDGEINVTRDGRVCGAETRIQRDGGSCGQIRRDAQDCDQNQEGFGTVVGIKIAGQIHGQIEE